MSELIVKQGYESYSVNAKFKTIKPFYFMYIPVPMGKYEELKIFLKKKTV